MSDNWEKLLAEALREPMRPEDLEAQRRSFAYGNAHLENAHITREMVDQEAEKLSKKQNG